jgi:hypothetical protein
VTLASNDILGLFGSGNHVIATGAGDSVWMGSNGQLSIGAAIDTINFYQGGYLSEMCSSNVTLVGSHVNVTINDWDTLSASGSAIHFTGSGPGEIVFIGGDGAHASNGDEDTGSFATGGTLDLFMNSRADVTGSNVTTTLMGDDTLGLYGAGDSVTGAAAGDAVWIGRNGRNATGANIDTVSLAAGGAITEMANSSLVAFGSNLTITMLRDDTLSLNPAYDTGGDDTVVASGANDIVNVSGSSPAVVTQNDTVAFKVDGVLNVSCLSTATAIGNGVTANVGLANPGGFSGQALVTLTGTDDTINFIGFGDFVRLGGNGQSATSANSDVYYLKGTAPSAVILANSTVTLNAAAQFTFGALILSGDDTLTLNTATASVYAYGGGDIVNLISNGQNAASAISVYFQTYNPSGYDTGILHIQANSRTEEDADNSSVTLFSQDTFTIGGTNNTVNIASSMSATNDIVDINGTATVNDLSPNYVTTGDTINVNFGATGTVNASHTVITAIDAATVIVNGLATIVELNPIFGNNYDYQGHVATVGGNGNTALGGSLANADNVWMGDLDTLNVADNSTVALTPNSADATHAGYAGSVHVGANDYVSLTGTYALFAPAKTGADLVTGFGGADTLMLTSTFANSAALLAATTYAAGNATIHLDKTGDTFTLAGVSQMTFVSEVNSGHIKI